MARRGRSQDGRLALPPHSLLPAALLVLRLQYAVRAQCGDHREYADRLMDEIDLVADALPENFPVGQVHFGGGSPNALGAELLAHA